MCLDTHPSPPSTKYTSIHHIYSYHVVLKMVGPPEKEDNKREVYEGLRRMKARVSDPAADLAEEMECLIGVIRVLVKNAKLSEEDVTKLKRRFPMSIDDCASDLLPAGLPINIFNVNGKFHRK